MPHAIAPVIDTSSRLAPWQQELATAVRDVGELRGMLGLSAAELPDTATDFPLLVPRGFVSRMRPHDPRDPLLLQVLPRPVELNEVAGFVADPLHEREAVVAPALVRKYAGRALLLAAAGCAVNCRYCFRREFPYAESGVSQAGLAEAIDAIDADPGLHEVILSGGDPLLLDDDRLGSLIDRIASIPHVRRLRVHTRLPVVLPSRVTAALADLLVRSRLRCIVVIHANHAAELDEAVASAIGRMAGARAILLNQAVLLTGVNDSSAALVALSERLVEIGVVPYYLHLLDRVRGTAHFDVGEADALRLLDDLRCRLPGYAVPRLAREMPGAPAKIWIG